MILKCFFKTARKIKVNKNSNTTRHSAQNLNCYPQADGFYVKVLLVRNQSGEAVSMPKTDPAAWFGGWVSFNVKIGKIRRLPVA